MADIININNNSHTKKYQQDIVDQLEKILEQAKDGNVTDMVIVYFDKEYSVKHPGIFYSSDRSIFMLGALEMAKEFIKRQFSFDKRDE